MHIIDPHVTKEMPYIRFVCSSKSRVCFTLNSASAFELSHFECPGAVCTCGCRMGEGKSRSLSLGILRCELGEPPGCFCGPWGHRSI